MPQHDRFEQNGIQLHGRSPALSIIIPKISSQVATFVIFAITMQLREAPKLMRS